MTPPRRDSDLTIAELDILISLCATRIHTMNNTLQKHSFSDRSALVATHKRLEDVLVKLEKMKTRERKEH